MANNKKYESPVVIDTTTVAEENFLQLDSSPIEELDSLLRGE